MIQVQDLAKHYANVKAVDGVSFAVDRGDIFGLLGPNGAGKTTIIRTIMDIIKPDAGTLTVMGQPVSAATKARIGYLPEERGLYKNFRLLECLTYLAALKGMPRSAAHERAQSLLERVDLDDYARRKIKELSKGMTQKAQFLAAIVQARGKTVILSTHNMNQVEELCNRILLINHGRAVLYGPLAVIQAQHTEHAVVLESDAGPEILGGLAGVQRLDRHNRAHLLVLEPEVSPQEILERLVEADVVVRRFEVATPPLEEIFIRAVGEGQ
jgi:ABC-2 type transport system ATP-binding protein